MYSIRIFTYTLVGVLLTVLFPLNIFAQNCTGLSVQIRTEESRCTATGAIQLTVTGGSDNYSFYVTGPVTILTSSSYITGLRPGTYDVMVYDLETDCFRMRRGIVIRGNYTTPSVTFTSIPTSCKNASNGEIRRTSLEGGRSPFSYTITAAPSSNLLGINSQDGTFTGLPAGSYSIQMEDSCSGLQTRTVTVSGYDWFLESANVINSGCGEATIQVALKDNQGKTSPDPVFNSFTYGWIRGNQDTVWHSASEFTLSYGTRRSIRVVAKDGCGNVSYQDVSISTNLSIDARVTSVQTGCNQFTAEIGSFTNFQQPEFCLLNRNDEVMACNTNGVFSQLDTGNYKIRVREKCYDTTILVPFTLIQSRPSVSEEIIVSRTDCGFFSARVQGLSGWNDPQFCLYSGNTLEYCNTTGIFGYLRNGEYRLEIKDGCYDTTIIRIVGMNGDKPSVGGVLIQNQLCQTFDAKISGANNLTNPQYQLYYNNNFIFSNTTGSFMDLGYGNYQVRIVNDPACYDTTLVIDFSASRPVPVISSQFTVKAGCNTADLQVSGQQNLTNPQYCLYNAVDSLLYCNSTGIFPSMPYGTYCVKVKNDPSCYDTTIVVCQTIERPVPDVGTVVVTSMQCTDFSIKVTGMEVFSNPVFTLKNEAGIVIGENTTGVFANLPYGSYCMDMDNNLVCNDTTITSCFTVENPKPSGGTVFISNRTCSGFTATVGGLSYVNNPQFIFKNQSGTILFTNNTGVFNVQGYFPYCIEIKNDVRCYDTVLVICQNPPPQPSPSSRGPLVFNQTCTTFSVRLLDVGGVTNPVYQLLQNGNVVNSATIPRFDNVPNGSYTFRIVDGCFPQPISYTVFVSATAADMILTALPGCTNNKTNVLVEITGGSPPFSVTIYDPMNNVVGTVQTSNSSYLFSDLSGLSAGLAYRVHLSDQCGRSKEATVIPQVATTIKSYQLVPKCPTGSSPTGVNELLVRASSNVGAVIPRIILRNGLEVNMAYEFIRDSSFVWPSLTPATYVVEYAAGSCTKSYDTVVVTPYTMPQLSQSAIYRCSNTTFSISTNMTGGVQPYQYQIVSSNPSTPSISTNWQSSPIFQIAGTQEYSLVRLRGLDACGNASLDDAGILPPERLVLNVSGNCFDAQVTLTANRVMNASYTWFRVIGTDSTVIGNGQSYQIPVLTRMDTGIYVVRMNVNAGCDVKEEAYRLTGSCVTLNANSIVLSGRKTVKTGELSFEVSGQRKIKFYEIERSQVPDRGFVVIGKVNPHTGSETERYLFIDQAPLSGRNIYRIKAIDTDGVIRYSNSVEMTWLGTGVRLFPNPAKQSATLTILHHQPEEVSIQVLSATGQLVYQQRVAGARQHVVTIPRMNLASGLYMVRISGLRSGITHMEKLIFE